MTNELENEQTKSSGGGKGLAILAFLIACATGGGGAYLYQEHLKLVAHLAEQKNDLGTVTKILATSEEKVINLINDNRKESLNNSKSLENKQENISNLFNETKSALEQRFIAESEATKKAIEEALYNYARGDLPKVDLEKEITEMNQIKEENKNTLKQVQEQVQLSNNKALEWDNYFANRKGELEKNIQDSLQLINTAISTELEKFAENIKKQANPQPFLNALAMADIAGKNGQYSTALLYLNEAKSAFNSYNLNQEPYLNFEGALQKLIGQYQELSQAQPAYLQINALMADLDKWQFLADPAKPVFEGKELTEESGVVDKILYVGNDFLKNTVTVIDKADRELSWVSNSINLQSIIRQNIRLDLGFARNALQFGDVQSFQMIVDNLNQEIKKYFNIEQAEIQNALAVLNQLKDTQNQAPDIGELVRAVEQVK